MEKLNKEKLLYARPETIRSSVSIERGIMISSAEPAGIDAENISIKVEEYQEVWNNITFE